MPERDGLFDNARSLGAQTKTVGWSPSSHPYPLVHWFSASLLNFQRFLRPDPAFADAVLPRCCYSSSAFHPDLALAPPDSWNPSEYVGRPGSVTNLCCTENEWPAFNGGAWAGEKCQLGIGQGSSTKSTISQRHLMLSPRFWGSITLLYTIKETTGWYYIRLRLWAFCMLKFTRPMWHWHAPHM